MNIRFNGCNDPADFLLRKSADNEGVRMEAAYASVRDYFKAVDEGRAEPVHPVYWSRTHNSWEDYKAAAIAAEDKFKQDEAMSVRFGSMPIRAVLAVLPGARLGEAQSVESVDAFAGRLERELNVKLADDYKTYLSACGRIAIGGIEHTGIDPSGEYDLTSAVREVREELGVPDRYYPLSALDSDKTSIIAFFQDGNGFVYFLDDTGLFEPAYDSLRSYIAGIWYAVEEDMI